MHFLQIKPKITFKQWLTMGAAIVLIFMVSGVFATWEFTHSIGKGEGTVSFTVQQGESVKSIGHRLVDIKIISSSYWFEVWVWLTKTEKHFVVGDYQLPTNSNIIRVTSMLTGGVEPNKEQTVTIIEGWTLKQISDYLQQSNVMAKDEFYSYATTATGFGELLSQYQDLFKSRPRGASLEGYLFPDTYRLFKDAKPKDLVVRMLNNLNEKFPAIWREQASRRGYSVHEVLTLASIVEKEVRSSEDRAMVADIFWRRLDVGMGLQADSTVNYITGKNSPAVSSKDLLVDSPYNTYRYKGLPPGPISNPGAEAIHAVVFPEANKYWYFLTTSDGKVIYSTTLDAHNQAKQKYLKN